KDHFQDIIDAGLGLTDRQLAETLVNKAPERLEDLKDYGINFRQTEDGELFHLKGCFASRSYAMVANKMKNVKCVFYQKAVNCGCDILDHTCALDIEKNDDGTFSFLAQRFNSEYLEIKAKSIVLATGGGSSIYKYNLNQPGQVGDGYHLGLKLGAKTINMEFIQM
ncbi:FAD-binding protein, partial [Candidatus Bipolaricaulota bacterium]|nr:FAD-binding protein [Candidatus Bipolaricaulota bacterium]